MHDDTPLESFKRATAATLRTLAERNDLVVSFGNEPGTTGSIRVPLPPAGLLPADVACVRGRADAQALRLRYHDDALHSQLAPHDPDARSAFDALEQMRCELLGARRLAGVAANLDAALDEDCRRHGLTAAHERQQVRLADALKVLARQALLDQPLPASVAHVADLWQDWLTDHAQADFHPLAAVLADQNAYARAAYRLLRALDLEVSDRDPQPQPQPDPANDNDDNADSASAEPIEQQKQPQPQPEAGAEAAADPSEEGRRDLPSEQDDSDAEPSPGRPEQHRAPAGDPQTYHAYTTQYDEIIDAAALCAADELERLRQRLDERLVDMQGLVGRLANRLQRLLMAQQVRDWAFDLEEGLLDTRRLDQIIVNPMTPLSFKQEKDMPFRDTVVTLLLDNSGSMRGWPIATAAMSADIIARTLERCAVKTEILGFTTRHWKGGQVRELWLAQGKPAHPGRLNELRHIIYKAADMPWRRARRNLGLMLQEGLLKQNIDGEALLWAHSRLVRRPEERRILMVISDGAPVDDATGSVNSGSYLDQHLRHVIRDIETRSPVRLAAIGIGHDVTQYYQRAVTITDPDQLAATLVNKLTELFDDSAGQRRRRR